MSVNHPDWVEDCWKWRRELLVGKYAHWCWDWDDLPIDETCREWPCHCGFQEHIDSAENETKEKPHG